ncbi:MAG: DUF1223 domain-containing protein [Alphaproteobacteria bacterium]
MKKFFAFAMLLCCFSCASSGEGNAASPIVLELYTSQNCPSCPPAEQLFALLVDQPDVIALACHITYFDTAQWRDVMSRDFCTKRQGAYNKAMGRGNRVFTPQAIVNGNLQVNGADRESVSTALIVGAAQNITPLLLRLAPDNKLDIEFPELGSRGSYAVRLMGYRKAFLSPPGPGRGATLYANAVNTLDDAGPLWQGEPRLVHFQLDASRFADGYAVIVEDAATKRIVAAGKLEP